MKTLIRKYDYGGVAPYVKNPNTWGSGASLSSVVPAVDLSYIDKDGFGSTGQTGGGSGFFGSILNSIGGAGGASSLMNGVTNLIQPGSTTPSNPLVAAGGDMMKGIAGNIAGKIGISSSPASGLVGAATDLGVGMLGKAFGKNTNYSDTGSQIANQIAGVASMFGPWGMAAGAAIKLANMLGSKEVKGVTHSEESQNALGSAYGLSQYDRDTKNFGLFGRRQAKKYEEEVNKMRGILARADDVAEDTRYDKLRQQGSIEGINSRNRMELTGGFRSLRVKKGGVLFNMDFVDNCMKMKNGGTFNIIPSGALHKERHGLEKDNPIFGDDKTTNKGIPVIEIKSNGEIKQHAEIERDEIIFRKECTDKLLEFMNSDDEDAAFKAGELLIDEIFNKTHDNTGMIRRIKVDKK